MLKKDAGRVAILVIMVALLVFSSGCIGAMNAKNKGTTTQPTPAVQNEDQGAKALIDKAWSLNAQGKFQEANAAVDQAAAMDQGASGIAFNRGWALAGLGRYAEALVALDQATNETPDSEIAWSNKGFVLSHLGRYQEAYAAYSRAHELDPTDLAVKQDLKALSAHMGVSGVTQSQTAQATSQPTVQPTTAPQPTDGPQQVVENMNVNAVSNGATRQPQVNFSVTVRIVSMYDYHWNDGKGATPGTITIQNVHTGALYGPFTATGIAGQGGAPNVMWQIEPGIVIPAGTYAIVDSDPATWSQNSQTKGAGMTHVVYQQTFTTTYTQPLVRG